MRMCLKEARAAGICVDRRGRAQFKKPVVLVDGFLRCSATNSISKEPDDSKKSPHILSKKPKDSHSIDCPQRIIFESLFALHSDQVCWEVSGLLPGKKYRADIYFPETRLIVELDGFQYHRSKSAFQSDRIRQNLLVQNGYTVLRYFTGQVYKSLDDVVEQINTVHNSLRNRLLSQVLSTKSVDDSVDNGC